MEHRREGSRRTKEVRKRILFLVCVYICKEKWHSSQSHAHVTLRYLFTFTRIQIYIYKHIYMRHTHTFAKIFSDISCHPGMHSRYIIKITYNDNLLGVYKKRTSKKFTKQTIISSSSFSNCSYRWKSNVVRKSSLAKIRLISACLKRTDRHDANPGGGSNAKLRILHTETKQVRRR